MWWYIQLRCHPSLVLYFQKDGSYIMASDHYMAVGVDQYIIDQDDEDCPEVGLHLAAWKGHAVQLEELLTCHKDHVQVNWQHTSRTYIYISSALHAVYGLCMWFTFFGCLIIFFSRSTLEFAHSSHRPWDLQLLVGSAVLLTKSVTHTTIWNLICWINDQMKECEFCWIDSCILTIFRLYLLLEGKGRVAKKEALKTYYDRGHSGGMKHFSQRSDLLLLLFTQVIVGLELWSAVKVSLLID